MDKICPIHKTNMRQWTKNNRSWYSHIIEGTEQWCNGGDPKEPLDKALGATEKAKTLPDVDWEAISKGKVRHGVVVAVIENGGLEALKGQISKINKIVDYIMTGELNEEN